jgi:prophage regulatory protein
MAILRIKEVTKAVGVHRATIYRLLAAGDFPRGLKLSERAIGWRSEEVQEWIEGRERA